MSRIKYSIMSQDEKNVEFKRQSNIVHNNKYDYSKSNYINAITKIIIICPIHGEFLQSPNSHLSGCGCPVCGGSLQSNTEEFIKKSNIKHNYFYDYSLVDYINWKTKVKIICPIHGIFEQTPNIHLRGSGCPTCRTMKNIISQSSNTEEFIKKANIKHNYFYDYSLVKYINCRTNVKIVCLKHGVFEQCPSVHLRGGGCPQCAMERRMYALTSNKDEFINKANVAHNYFYDYSLVNYINARIAVKIICPIHGEFLQTPDLHLGGGGCPKCKNSHGEIIIENYLIKNSLNYETQKKFPDCRYKKLLKFDFYLHDYNMCVEFDGMQHYYPPNFSKDPNINIKNFELTQIRDKIKNEYCKEKGIKMLRISYLDKDRIQEILNKELNIC